MSFIAGVLLIIFDGGLASAGPMAISGGCCAGSLITLVSMVLIALGLNQNSRLVELLYVQE
tara:strand:+ start:8905 stop:9087 length:183 start_codon:yes stop_codon:yes gene_type:complete